MNESTKADKNINKHSQKEASQDDEEDEEDEDPTAPPKVLYRLTIDYRLLNKSTRNDTSIVLPSSEVIEQNFQDSIVSTYDLSNQIFHLKFHKNSQKYFNFYVQHNTWKHNRCAQGWSASPLFA